MLSRIATANLRNHGTDALISISAIDLIRFLFEKFQSAFFVSVRIQTSGIPGEDGLAPLGEFYTQQFGRTRRKDLKRYGICLHGIQFSINRSGSKRLLICGHGTDILCSMKNMIIRKYFMVLVMMTLPTVAGADSHQTEVPEDVVMPFPSRSESQKIMIGEIEDVMLVPWSVTLPARIDTGASISSLDGRNISVRNNIVAFMLGKEYGGLQLQLPVVDWVYVRSSIGTEKRPVVQIEICLGPKLVRTLATLRDRSQMTYPFLIGRNVLNGSFVVDTSRAKAVRPACPSGSLSQIQ